MYRPTDPDGFGVVVVVSLDVAERDAGFSAAGIVAEPGLVYSSLEALYLTDTQWDYFGNERTTTDIYKLDYEGRGAVPVATGSVSGRVLNQYSMGESDGFFRVATTSGSDFWWGGSEQSNNVYVLEQTGDSLVVAGRIEDIAPGEEIMSARFIGDRGYLVTFEQIDPLFTLDLTNPRNPQVVGELEGAGLLDVHRADGRRSRADRRAIHPGG